MARWRLRMEEFGRRQDQGGSQTSEAWHRPRWAAKIKGGDVERPLSSMSTRPPSTVLSPSTSPRANTPRTPSPMPQGSLHSSPAPPSVRAGGEFWAAPRTPKTEKRRSSRDGPELPTTYSLRPESLGSGSLLPPYELWVTLHGGNGRWQQVKAQQEWSTLLLENEEAVVIRKREAEQQRLRRAEAARQRRAEEEELSRRVEEAEADKKRRKEEELRLQQQREEDARRARLEEERLRESLKPRKCQRCSGSGRCHICQGEGSVDVLFLAPYVGSRHQPIPQGRRPRGCRQCGGVGDGSLFRDFVPGSGRCDVCLGAKVIQPPPGGFKTPAKPEESDLSAPVKLEEDVVHMPGMP